MGCATETNSPFPGAFGSVLGEGSGFWEGAFPEQNEPKTPDVSGDSVLVLRLGQGSRNTRKQP